MNIARGAASRNFVYGHLLGGFAACAFLFGLATETARAGRVQLPPEAAQAIEKMYGGDPDGAIAMLHTYESAHPDDPLPYTIEAEARWWKMFCDAAEIKWGMMDSQKRGKRPGDESYFAAADRAIQLAQAAIAKNDTSENHLYAGIGYALKTRLYGLRNENRTAAHNGVAARTEFLRALELDPNNADASVGIGFYNYYVDTLSPVVKLLRFFMGIPGGRQAGRITADSSGRRTRCAAGRGCAILSGAELSDVRAAVSGGAGRGGAACDALSAESDFSAAGGEFECGAGAECEGGRVF